jgi:hypothetical protein
MSYPRVIFCRLSQPTLARGWLAYGIGERGSRGVHYCEAPAESLPRVASGLREAICSRDPASSGTESTACGSPAAGEGAGRASEGQALPAALVRRAPAPRSGEERDE